MEYIIAMEVIEFQKRIEELCSIAQSKNGILSKESVLKHFQGSSLDQNQMTKVLQYLKIKGIQIEGAEEMVIDLPGTANEGEEQSESQPTIVPLTPEEEEYLEMYLRDFKDTDLPETEIREKTQMLLESILRGEESAKAQMMQLYLPITAKLAVELNCEEIFLEDLIQEATIGLLTALDQLNEKSDSDWICEKIRNEISKAIKAQTQQNFEDECLVAKVEKLESAVKDLTDDDNEVKFSVNELAIILDMDVDEIRGVLRLTGDDK